MYMYYYIALYIYIYIHIYIYIYRYISLSIYLYLSISISISLSLYIYIYMHRKKCECPVRYTPAGAGRECLRGGCAGRCCTPTDCIELWNTYQGHGNLVGRKPCWQIYAHGHLGASARVAPLRTCH